MVMGFALMLVAGGLLVLTLRVLRVLGKEETEPDLRLGGTQLRRLQWFSASARVVAPDGTSAVADEDRCHRFCDEGTAVSLLIDSPSAPSGARPPKLKRTIGLWMATALVVGIAKGFVLLLLGVPVYVLMVWWRGREEHEDVIPEPSARAQVEAAHAREPVMA